MAAILIVLALPIVAIAMLALVAAVVVFGALAAVTVLLSKVWRAFPRSDGRENVRVVRVNRADD